MKNKGNFVTVIGALTLLAGALPAQAEIKDGVYGIVGIGHATTDLGVSGSGVDDEDMSLSLGIGFPINEQVAIEVGYLNLGEASMKASGAYSLSLYGDSYTVINPSIVFEADGFYAGGRFRHAIDKQFSIHGKVGLYFWDLEGTASASSLIINGYNYGSVSYSESDSGQDLYFGFGGAYQLNDRVSLLGEFTRYEVSDSDVDVFGINLAMKF